MNTTDYAYDSKFERIANSYGVNYGMFGFSDKTNGYISPIVKQLYIAYKNNELNQKLVNNLLKSLA